MQKIVINVCAGGFTLSDFAMNLLGYSTEDNDRNVERDNPYLVSLVERFGQLCANTKYSELAIVEIPDGVDWIVVSTEYGYEYVAEQHRVWYYSKK